MGFLIGQGSAFGIQALLVTDGRAAEGGQIAIFISIFSFALQFADIGNAVRGVTAAKSGRTLYEEFLEGRALIGCVLSTVVAFVLCLFASVPMSYALVAAPLFGLAGALYASVETAKHELKGDLSPAVSVQALSWIWFATIAFMGASLPTGKLALLLGLSASCAAGIAARRTAPRANLRLWGHGRAAVSVAPYLSSWLIGQLWGRIVLACVGYKVGMEGLAYFGMVRQVEIGIILAVGFIVRPGLQRAYKIIDVQVGMAPLHQLLRTQKLPLTLAAATSVSAIFTVALSDYSPVPAGFREWLPLLIAVFPAAVALFVAQVNQRSFGPRQFLLLEKTSFFVSAMCFLALIGLSAPYALLLSECVPLVVTLLGRRLIVGRVNR